MTSDRLASAATSPSRVRSRLRSYASRYASTLRWYVRGVLQEDAYDRYLAVHAATHPEVPALTARQFWKERLDYRDKHPGMRCC